jgi:sugar lactone lactonase YvrE
MDQVLGTEIDILGESPVKSAAAQALFRVDMRGRRVRRCRYPGGTTESWTMRCAPDGGIDRVLPMPVRKPTSCAFGGPNLDILFVTTASQGPAPEERARQPLAGAVLMVDPGARGLPEPLFAA